MPIGRADRLRMERAHVRAWPALRTADIQGWLWRCSGGGSQRANSVATIDFTGTDPEAAVTLAETLYRAAGRRAQFQIFDETSPPGLADLLRARGYRRGKPTVTMFGRPGPAAADPGVEIRDRAWDEWQEVYLREITEDRRAVNAEILQRIPQPSAFFGCRRDGRIVSTALCVAGYGCAVIECVTTRADARRQGSALAVLTAVSHWASVQDIDRIGLQVVADNAPAVALYQHIGFVTGATNSFWLLQ
nr:GNAT family N-acetyltransferase [uncultured Rhodopila sp.]